MLRLQDKLTIYVISYHYMHGYTLCRGIKEITMWADDEYDPRELMWEAMESEGLFTQPVTAKFAHVLGQKEVE